MLPITTRGSEMRTRLLLDDMAMSFFSVIRRKSLCCFALSLAASVGPNRQHGFDWSKASGAACAPAPAGLVSWWRAEGDASDSIGSNDGVTPLGIEYAPGEVGQAFSFNGTTTRVVVQDDPAFQLNALTIEGWIYPKSWGGVIFWRGNDQTDAFQLDLLSAAGIALGCNTPSGVTAVVLAPIQLNQWQHVAATIDGAGGDMKLYINGVLATQTNTSLSPAIPFASASQPALALGNHGVVYYNLPYTGLLDEFSLYSRPLSQGEIETIYAAGQAGKCLPITPPVILSQPASLVITAGGTAAFRVSARSAAPLSYQWFFGSAPIAGQTNASLVLSNTQADSQGTYFVSVSNTNSTLVSSNVFLTVLTYPPTVTLQPQSTNIYAGSTISLLAGAAGSPPLTYQWQKGGAPLGGAFSATYTITNAQLADSGGYSVVITNEYGAATSLLAQVIVRLPPDCIAPPLGLVGWWRCEGNLLDAWGANNGLANTSGLYGPGKVGVGVARPFVVPGSVSLHLTNALTIQAWVNPAAASTASTPARTIAAKWQLSSVQSVGQSSFYLGTTNDGQLYFAVTPDGLPVDNVAIVSIQRLPTNHWSLVTARYDGAGLSLLLDGSLVAGTNYSRGIFPGDSNFGVGGIPGTTDLNEFYFPFFPGGLDEVNLFGRALSDSEVKGVFTADIAGLCLEPPTILAQPTSQSVPVGEDRLLSVSVQGTRPLNYQWFFNGNVPIRGATNAGLALEKVGTNQAGNYSILVSNAFGAIRSSNASLSLLPAPTCAESPSGMISWWPADGSGLDVVGTNNVYGVQSFPSGKVGRAFGGPAQAANSASLNFSSNADFTIEGWIRPFPSAPSLSSGFTPIRPIVQKAADQSLLQRSASPGYLLFLHEGTLAFWLGAKGTPANRAATFKSPGPDLRDDLFHHVAVSLHRSSTTGGTLYVDGNLVLTFDPTAQNGDLSNSEQLLLGSGSALFNGLLDEMAIYDRALSASEIQVVAAAGTAGKCKQAPFLLAQPESQRVLQGGVATFQVTAEGTPSLRFQWRLNSRDIVGATRASLTITNAQLNNSGSYSVEVSNAFGIAVSSPASLRLDLLPIANRGQAPNSVTAAELVAGNKGSSPQPHAGSAGRPPWLELRQGGLVRLHFCGPPAQARIIQASSNLVDWEQIGVATADQQGNIDFDLSGPGRLVQRFYRVVSP